MYLRNKVNYCGSRLCLFLILFMRGEKNAFTHLGYQPEVWDLSKKY